MSAKIFAGINIALALFLLALGTQAHESIASYYDAGALASGIVAAGCWKQIRWLACIGAVPIILVGLMCLAAVGRMTRAVLTPNEAGPANLIILATLIFEIASIVVAAKPQPEPSESDRVSKGL